MNKFKSHKKHCSNCDEWKKLSDFHKVKSKPHGVSIYCKACTKDKDKERNLLLREKVINHYGGHECVNCDETFKEVLVLDHMNGGGEQERKTYRGNSLFYKLKREGYPPGYQVMCLHCNFLKSFFPEKLNEYKSHARVV